MLDKFSAVGEKCVLVGSTPNSYRLLIPEKNKIVESSDVEFTESVVFKDQYGSNYFKHHPWFEKHKSIESNIEFVGFKVSELVGVDERILTNKRSMNEVNDLPSASSK